MKKKKMLIEIEGQPFNVLDVFFATPTARGASTMVRTKLKNLLNGAVLEKTFRTSEKFPEPDVEDHLVAPRWIGRVRVLEHADVRAVSRHGIVGRAPVESMQPEIRPRPRQSVFGGRVEQVPTEEDEGHREGEPAEAPLELDELG